MDMVQLNKNYTMREKSQQCILMSLYECLFIYQTYSKNMTSTIYFSLCNSITMWMLLPCAWQILSRVHVGSMHFEWILFTLQMKILKLRGTKSVAQVPLTVNNRARSQTWINLLTKLYSQLQSLRFFSCLTSQVDILCFPFEHISIINAMRTMCSFL